MAPAPLAGAAFFPLDEQLGLLAGGLTPRAEETLVRLATWMPYAQAQELLADLVGIQVSKATARRATLSTGQAALALDEAEEERLKQEVPQAPEGADKQQLSADGAMVHLVGGEWVEVKTLIIGELTCNKRGEVCTQQLSTFSRLAEAERFTQATLVETHRRGLEQARAVCAVQDGAEWLQKLVDYHRADAVRILDFAHAAEYVNEIGQAVQAAGGKLPTWWFEAVRHRLKHEGPMRVLKHLSWLAARYPSPTIQEKLAYLHKREAHMHYPSYQAAGWPIGSGSVESAGYRWSWKHGSKERACAGRDTTSIPCWCCAMRSAIGAGTRAGRQQERIKRLSAPVGDKPGANSGSTVPFGPSCTGEHG